MADLRGITLDEDDRCWIQGMSVGTYQHPLYGPIEFTPERIKRFADGVKGKVRGIDLDVDYAHKARTDEAAGWIKDAETRDDGLWLLVEWTKTAAAKIKEGAYRYFSPDFVDEWEDPKSGNTIKDVLCGGGITNRPFLKDMVPINLSEVMDHEKEGEHMNEELIKLRIKLGLPEDATKDQILAAATAKVPDPQAEKDKAEAKAKADAEAAEAKAKADAEKSPELVALEERLAEARKFAEDNPNMAPIVTLLEQQATQLQETQKELAEERGARRLADIDATIKSFDEGKNRLPKVSSDKLRAFLLTAPKQFAEAAVALVKELSEVGFIEGGERGSSGSTGDKGNAGDALKRYENGVKKLQEDDSKLSYADAAEKYFKENPSEFEAYHKALETTTQL